MKILFINPIPPKDVVRVRVSMGVASLSAILKREGHQTELLLPENFDTKQLATKVESYRPDLVAVSSVSDQFDLAKSIITYISLAYKIPIIIGGIHATVAPEECIKTEAIGVCIGEGDEAIVEFVNLLRDKKDYTKVKNFWFNKDGEIIKNPLRPLIKDLNTLPFPDRDLFEPYLAKDDLIVEFMASRGCPFQCHYCINHVLQGHYGMSGYLRRRSVDNVLEEIMMVLTKYRAKNNGSNPKRLEFHDDLFTADKVWLREFADKYSQKINQPYAVNARIETIDEETIILLHKSGCAELKLGIESGNERIRKEVLNRHMTNEQIINCFALCRKYGLSTSSFNMIGIPGETEREIFDTIEINKIVKPTVVGVSVFQPYKGTRLHNLCQEKGYLTDKKVMSFYEGKSTINIPTLTPEQIEYHYKTFQVAVYHPKLLPLVNFLITIKLYQPITQVYKVLRRFFGRILTKKQKDFLRGRQ